jgi:hypothetical protein
MSDFDKKLAERVRVAFDQYRDQTDLAALATIRERLSANTPGGTIPGKIATPAFSFWIRTALAAMLVLALGVSVWWYAVPEDRSISMASDVHSSESGNIGGSSDDINIPMGVIPDSSNDTDHVDPRSNAEESTSLPTIPIAADSLARSEPQSSDAYPIAALRATSAEEFASLPVIPIAADSLARSEPQSSDAYPIAALRATSAEEFASLPTIPIAADSLARSEPQSSDAYPIAALRANRNTAHSDSKIDPASEIHPTARRSPDGNRTELIAGSILSWSDQQFDMGLGFTAGALQNWRVGRGMRVSAGAQLSYNRFGVDRNNDIEPRIATLSDAGSSFSTEFINRVNYDLLAVEIPFTVTVDLTRQAGGTIALTTGISSLWYIRQSFSDEMVSFSGFIRTNAPNGQTETLVQATNSTRKESPEPFSRFDAAGLLNLSLGFTPDASRLPVSFDLYVKYPLGNLTDREITYGMGGVTLRYRIR